MLRIGITGGIGSGKSTIAKIFQLLGVPVYYADKRAKWLMENNTDLKNQLIESFGSDTYQHGLLNRSHLASLVFSNPENLNLLNKIVHPFTINDGIAWMKKQTSQIAIKEAALIFETGTQADFDVIIGVFAPVSLRIKRTMNRDNISREQVMERMNNQIDAAISRKLSDFVIDNDESSLITPSVIAIHKQLLELAKKTM